MVVGERVWRRRTYGGEASAGCIVSDWLTKIIFGLSLVQIGKLPWAVGQLGRTLAPALGYAPDGRYACPTAATSEGAVSAIAVTMCLDLVFAFMIGYLWARVTFTRLLRDSDMTDSTTAGATSPAADGTSGTPNPAPRCPFGTNRRQLGRVVLHGLPSSHDIGSDCGQGVSGDR
jgi:hypothetical protein